MDGTTNDWRADLLRHPDGTLDPPATCWGFTRSAIEHAARTAAGADAVRILEPGDGVVIVLVRLDHEHSPGGARRADRLEYLRDALELSRPAGILLAVAEDAGEELAPLCRRCGERLDEGQPGMYDGGDADTGNGACPSCCERDAWKWTLDGVFGEPLARMAEREIHRRIAHDVATSAMIGNIVWRDGLPYRCTGMVNRTTPEDAREGRIVMGIQLAPVPYIILETTIGEGDKDATAITPIEESNDDADRE